MGGDPEEMERRYHFSHRIAEELRLFRSVLAQTVTSEVQRQKLEELYGFTSDRIAVVPPGVDVDTFRPPAPGERRRPPGLPERYILCLSRIDANKGHDLLLRAFEVVRKAVPDVHLVIGGGSPSPQQTESEVLAMMRGIIEAAGMGGSVHIIGYIPDEDLVATYQRAGLFVLPSVFEPFGMTALEAMACGRPVVASSLGGIREVITSGVNGLLADPTDAEEFATTMVALLRDPALAERVGSMGRRLVVERYSWDAVAARQIEFYEKYLGG
jgi:mannosylfructose-phosphate synthase